MVERPAVDASPLIFLSRGGFLDFLQLVGSEVVIPSTVMDEIQKYGDSDVTVRAIAKTDWLVVVPSVSIPAIVQNCHLDRGEESVLAWGYSHPGTEIIVDDLAGRRCANSLGIPIRGTLGLVLTAKQRKVIPAALPILEQLRQSGMYLSGAIIDRALRLVGE